MILNLNQLRSFHAAAKTGSITRAADELLVTPAAVTLQIKQLEENLGIKLLVRSGNSMQLTDAGGRVFERARKIFEDVQNLETFLADIGRMKSGVLKIGCSETAAVYVMPRLIKIFKQTYPDIKVIIDRGTNEDMIRSLLEHKHELLIVRHRPEDKRLKMRHMGRQEILLVASQESNLLTRETIPVAELGKIPLIVPLKGSATREIVHEYLKRFQVAPQVVMESSSTALIKKLVREDEGVSFLCRDVVEEELAKGVLKEIQLREGPLFIEYGIGYLNRNNLSRASLAFLRMLEQLKDLL
ncbi:MAG: LysR family transcriptional regulator [Deltaproteobacteria bacterium]|nr:LysR family transcriptional regulator [Deltaproteobacteria bacterium]